jgi:hypothetical protein
MAHELFPFRFQDPVTGKWVRARYHASADDIARRYASARVDGEGRSPPGMSAGFDRFRGTQRAIAPGDRSDASLQMQPDLVDGLERFLVASFLRRYVTWCARRGRFAAMNGAAHLLRDVARTR